MRHVPISLHVEGEMYLPTFYYKVLCSINRHIFLLSSLVSRLLLLPRSLFWHQLSVTKHHNLSNSVTNGAVPKLGRVVPCHSHDRLPWNLLAQNITIDPEFGVEI